MYVLPYGQMSLWGATVITNLLSAIPWLGKDIVEFVWGGLNTVEPLYGDVKLKILLNAGKSPIIAPTIWDEDFKESFGQLEAGYTYDLFLIMMSIIYVKTVLTGRQSAGVRNLHISEASQRLNAENLTHAYLVGLFEANGYFSISKNGEHLIYEIGINLSIKDVQLIYKIKKILGVGTVNFIKKSPTTSNSRLTSHIVGACEAGNINTVSLRVRNKNHLKQFIIPIFDKYPMFSNKQYYYLRFKNALCKEIIFSKDLPEYVKENRVLNSIDSILDTHYFSAWLVGFIEAEGRFSFYKLKNEYLVASFDIVQEQKEILYVINKYLSFNNNNIYKDETNNFKLEISEVKFVDNLINFLHKAPVKLLGNKKLQYLLWLKQLRNINKYSSKINIPSKY